MGLGPEAAGSAADWITASLCDGEDEKSDQLDKALRELDDEGERARRLRIRALRHVPQSSVKYSLSVKFIFPGNDRPSWNLNQSVIP